MSQFGVTRDKWVCPTDRELVLRSRLQTGWSVKTHSLNTFNKPVQLNDSEQDTIKSVIDRAECLERQEQERVGRLVERVENMKKNAIGNGETQCILCADEFSMLRSSPLHCYDCRKAVCSKCGVDTYTLGRDPVWLCKICSETREMWKKSGAWFFKSIPKYVMPKKKESGTQSRYKPHEPSFGNDSALSKSKAWSQGRFLDSSERESTDSSDDDTRIPRATLALSERLSSSQDMSASAESPSGTFGGAMARELPYHYESYQSANHHSHPYRDLPK